MSSLQCPTRLFVARPGLGSADIDELVAALAGQRIARVWQLVSSVSVHSTIADVLEDVVDQHRGESVLVLSRDDEVGAVLAALWTAHDHPLPPAVELEADDDGWRIVRWLS